MAESKIYINVINAVHCNLLIEQAFSNKKLDDMYWALSILMKNHI